MSLKHGIDSKIYLNTGTYPAPVFVDCDLFGDAEPGGDWDSADIITRRGRVKFGAKTMMGAEFSGSMLCDDADTNYLAFLAAWKNVNGTVDLLILDGPIDVAGSFGTRMEYQVTQGKQTQKVGDVLYRAFAAKPYPTANKPKFATVNTGSTLASPNITYEDI